VGRHIAPPRRVRRWFLGRGSGRVRALLCLGLVTGLGFSTSLAYWTDEASVTGATFTAGTLDLAINGGDPYASTTLSMTAMVPGSTSAEILTVQNVGSAPLKYTLTGGLSGGDASAFATHNALRITIRSGAATVVGSGDARTCNGGSALVTDQALTGTTSTSILTKRPVAPLAGSPSPPSGGGSETLCIQISLSGTAPSDLQGRSVTALLTATGSSDVS